MFEHRRAVAAVDVGEGMGAAAVADEQRIALRVVAGVLGPLADAHQPAVGVLAAPRRNTLRDDAAAGVAADVDHLRARVGLLEMVGHRHRVELARRVVAQQHAARVFPGDGRARLDLRPRQTRVLAAKSALGDEIVDAAAPLLVARVPVLDGRIFHLGVALNDDFDHGGMQLVFVALRRRAPFEVAHVGALVGDDERAFELPRSRRINAEIGRKLHRAAHPLRDVAERAVREDGGIQRRVEIVGMGNDLAEVLAHQLGMLLERLGDRAEDDPLRGQRLAEGGLHRDGVHHGVDRHSRQRHLLLERNAQAVEGAFEFGIDLVHRVEPFFRFRRRIVDDLLKVDLGNVEVGPGRRRQRQPVAIGLQPPLGHPRGLALLGRNEAHDLFAQAATDQLGLDIRGKTVFVLLFGEVFQYLLLF